MQVFAADGADGRRDATHQDYLAASSTKQKRRTRAVESIAKPKGGLTLLLTVGQDASGQIWTGAGKNDCFTSKSGVNSN